MRRSIVLMTLAAVAIAAVLLVSRRYREPAMSTVGAQQAPPSLGEGRPAVADAQTREKPSAKREDSTPEILDDRPFTEIRPELERRALAGDAVAARRLGLTLANCNRFVDVSDEKIEETVVDSSARGMTVKDGNRVVPPDEMLSLIKLGMRQKRHDCKGVSGLDEPDAWKKAFQWIERAAALGDADAQAVYGTLAFADFDARNALVDAERMRDRKQLAIDYLQRSLAQGDAQALMQMSGRYADGLLFAPDPEKAYAYVWAYSLTHANDVAPELLHHMLDQRAAPLDEPARERARAEGQQLAACCGIVAPGTP